MMVKQKRILIEPGDIVQLHVQCPRCGNQFPVEWRYPIPERCPLCSHDWRMEGLVNKPPELPVKVLMDALYYVSSQPSPVSVLLEITPETLDC